MKIRAVYGLIALLFLATFGAQSAHAQRPDQITFALGWLPSGVYAPYVVALDKGYYAEANLAVTIVRGYGSGDTVKRVAAGRADIGSADTGALISAKSQNDIAVKIVAMIEGQSPSGILYLEQSGIKGPGDLVGKTVGRSAGGASTVLLPAFLEVNKIQPDQVKFVVTDATAFLPMLLSRKVDALVDQKVVLPKFSIPAAKEGLTVKAMTYAEHGLPTYGAAIIVNESLIKSRPEVIRKFLAASFKGFKATFANVDEAAEILRKYYPENEQDVAVAEIKLEQELVMTDDVKKHGLGYIDPATLTRTRDLLGAALKFPNQVKIEDLYTADFLPR